MKKYLKKIILVGVVLLFIGFALSYRKTPETIMYGVSFSKFRAEELGLNAKAVFDGLIDDLHIMHFRLSAHWPMIEPSKNNFSFTELDYELGRVSDEHGDAILAVGRRLPSWPECHVPDWAKNLSWEDQKKEILLYITSVVTRYRSHSEVKYWQVENEPYLTVFAPEYCGGLDEAFLKEEIALVKQLDPTRKILVTDSGNLGLWGGAWKAGDVFGTSVYIYLWNPTFGQVKSWYRPFVYRIKTNLATLLYGKHESLLIELSLEPWLLHPITETSLDLQKERMSLDRFDESIAFAKETRFGQQYLWGAEWWYYMKEKGEGGYWEKARTIFSGKQ